MVSCIKIETASLIFAFLSILINSVGSVWLGVYIVRVCMAMADLIRLPEKDLTVDVEILITSYSLYVNITLTVFLSILVVALAFSIILTKGLLSKNSYLVKAYFIYGVTSNTLSALFALFAILTFNFKIISIFLFGCFLYYLILIMIRKTYLKLAALEKSQNCKKNPVEEKNISSQL